MYASKTVYCTAVKDCEGEVITTVFDDWCNTIQSGGRNEDGMWEHFDSVAHHISDWCERNGFTLYVGEEEVEFEMEEQ